MARKLFNFCLAWTLVLGCWGGVLAAVVCPHVGCETGTAAREHAGTDSEHSTDGIHESAGAQSHTDHAENHQEHAEKSRAFEEAPPKPQGLRSLASSPHDPSCIHCVGGPQSPPSTKSEWQFNSAKKAEKGSAPPAARHLPAPSRAFVMEITPAQHAPPAKPGRHLLLSVFLI